MNKPSGSSPIHERIRDHLLDQIQNGALAPGQALSPERKMAEELKVSRHTLRQALSSLEAFGLIEIRHGSGIYVTASAPDEAIVRVSETVIAREGTIPKILEVRRALEPYVARLAATRRTDEDLENIEPLATYSRDPEAAIAGRQSTSFHREIAKATQNLVFDGVMRTLITGPRRAESLLRVVPSAREIWEAQHRAIFLAIKDRDGETAERLMAEHLDTVIEATTMLGRTACG